MLNHLYHLAGLNYKFNRTKKLISGCFDNILLNVVTTCERELIYIIILQQYRATFTHAQSNNTFSPNPQYVDLFFLEISQIYVRKHEEKQLIYNLSPCFVFKCKVPHETGLTIFCSLNYA